MSLRRSFVVLAALALAPAAWSAPAAAAVPDYDAGPPAKTEKDYWSLDNNSAALSNKAIDFLKFGGNVCAVMRDGSVCKRDAGGWDATPIAKAIPTSHSLPAGYTWDSGSRLTYHLWPQVIEYDGGGTSRLYAVREYTYVEKRDSDNQKRRVNSMCVWVNAGAGGDWTESHIIKRPQTGFASSAPGRDVAQVTNTNGYLFKADDGGTTKLYWGGGGSDTSGNATWKYVWKYDGADWELADRTIGPDQFTRDMHAAMPDGYRWNQLISFDSSLWDYHGYYTVAEPFTYTEKVTGLTGQYYTEPWGHFQMGVFGGHLYRMAFSRIGNKNFLVHINGTGGSWTRMTSTSPHVASDSPPGHATDPAGTGTVYFWRGCAGTTSVTSDPAPGASPTHNGLYCVFSRVNVVNGADQTATYDSGIYKYADENENGTYGWRLCLSSKDDLGAAEATRFTGAIFIDDADSDGGTAGIQGAAVYVGASNGIYRRGIADDDPGPPAADQK